MSLFPRRWPVRWRLAAVSATLTFVILVAFALAIGQLASDRLRDDFEREVLSEASQVRLNIEAQRDLFEGIKVSGPDLDELTMAGDAAVRIVDPAGNPLKQTTGAPDLGPPDPGLARVRGYEVVAQPVAASSFTGEQLYLQYARTADSVESTIDRLWIFLAGGVIGGTILATLAGLAVAGRAMRPIAALTAAAREIAATRDPSRRLPAPENEDEVAELAATLDEMLRQLDAARGETEQMIQAQREFVADASHELRTPLTSILANLELLSERLERADPDGEEAEIVGNALDSSRRMRRLVSDLLLLARADAGRSGPRRPCDLTEIAAAALAEVRPVAGDRRLVIEADDPVPVDGNPDDLHRLVLNLLENAVRHTPEGTEVRLDVGRRDGSAVLEVTDDGPGIPPAAQAQIFSRFVRVEGPADTSVDSGTGLGLAIVKAVASSHGGDVVAGAAPAGGARFTVRLPLDQRLPAKGPVATV